MPYIESSKVAAMRKAIRKALPNYKISVTKRHSSSVEVRIMSGPIVGAENVNVYWYKEHFGPEKQDRPDVIALIDTIKAELFKVETPRELVYDGDYGSVPTFYWDVSFGKWDKPYVCTDPDAADRLMIRQELARNRRFHEQERRHAQWKAERETAQKAAELKEDTIWEKWECERGNRWTSVVGSPMNDCRDGATCQFSGCAPDHVYHSRGYAKRHEAHDWFYRAIAA